MLKIQLSNGGVKPVSTSRVEKKVIVKGLNTILVFMNYKDAAVRYKDANN